LDDKQIPLVTGADVIDTVYLDGIATNLKPSDALFFIFGPNAGPTATPPQQYMRFVRDVDAQAEQKRTAVTLALVVPPRRTAVDELTLYMNKASFLFPGSDLAQEVVRFLDPVIANLASDPGSTGDLLQAATSRIALIRGIAVQRGFTRVAAWLAMLLRVLQWISLGTERALLLGSILGGASPPGATPKLQRLPAAISPSPLVSPPAGEWAANRVSRRVP